MSISINIRKKLPAFTIDISMVCRPGELTAIIGPSGAGKSTLIRLIAGLDVPDSGTITFGATTWFDDKAGIMVLPQQRRIGMVFQEYPLFPHLTVWNNITFGASDTAFIRKLLDVFNISHLVKQKPSTMSGGERQRTALCQALARRPQLLLLDEPFSALDIKNRQEIRTRLKEIARQQQLPVLHVTHDLEEAFSLADHLFVMEDGKESQTWLRRQFTAGIKNDFIGETTPYPHSLQQEESFAV